MEIFYSGIKGMAAEGVKGHWREMLAFGFVLLALAIVFNFLLIANPGYFNHDELTIITEVDGHSTKEVLSDLGTPPSGMFFRPIPHTFARLALNRFGHKPQMVHLLSVLVHALTAFALFFLLRKIGSSIHSYFAHMASALFLIIPLGSYATGWAVGVYDQFYTLFAVLALLWLVNTTESEGLVSYIFAVLAAGALTLASLCSKETGLMICAYGFVMIYALKMGRKAWGGLALIVAVSLVFFYIRSTSLMSGGPGPYSMQFGSNIYKNLFKYLAYPFSIGTAEIYEVFEFSSLPMIVFAFVVHATLIMLLALRHSKYALWYVVGFVLTLAPVLVLGHKKVEAQYMYATAIPLACALAYILMQKQWLYKAFGAAAVAILIAHTAVIQWHFYDCGVRQTRIQTSLESLVGSASGGEEVFTDAIVIYSEPGAPWWVLQRTVFNLEKIGKVRIAPVQVMFDEVGKPARDEFIMKMSVPDAFPLVLKKDGLIVVPGKEYRR